MPNLPTLTVTQAQADRILAVFGDVATYKAWLRDSLILAVTTAEQQVKHNAYIDAAKTANDATVADFGTIT